MQKEEKLEVLKEAMLIEKRGMFFYASVARLCEDEGARSVFEFMAREEEDHLRFLQEHYTSLQGKGYFNSVSDMDNFPHQGLAEVLNGSIRVNITAASDESAALYAAMLFEERGIAFYSEQAAKAVEPEEKQFYQWLAEWEKEHLDVLKQFNQELLDEIWNDDSFWMA